MVEPAFQDVRQGVGRSVTLRCTMLKGSPMKVATSVWRFNGTLLAQPPVEQQDYSELKVDSVSRETSGNYECSISNDVGVSACLFQVSGKSQSARGSELLDGGTEVGSWIPVNAGTSNMAHFCCLLCTWYCVQEG